MTGVLETVGEILDIAPDVVPHKGAKRSSEWPAVRDAYLAEHPTCAVCGGKESLNVHHVIPFEFGGPELDPENMITLCRGTFNCHLLFGHLGAFSALNPLVRSDAAQWRFRFAARKVLTRMAKKELKALRGRQK